MSFMNFDSSSAVTVSLTDEGPLTEQERDRLTLEVLEKKIAAKVEDRKRLVAIGEQADRLKAEVDDLVDQLLNKLDRLERTFPDMSFSSTGTTSSGSPFRNHLNCIALHRNSGVYGCGEVYAGLEAEMQLLRGAIASLAVLEGNPLSGSGSGKFREDARQIKEQLAQFVEKVSNWSRYCLECLSDHREGVTKK